MFFKFFKCFVFFMGFLTNEKTQNKMTKNEKTKQEIKERVRGTYPLVTLGGRCWVCSNAIGAVVEVCVGSARSTGAADGSAGSTGAAEGSAGSTGATEGSAGSTGAAWVVGDTNLNGAAIRFAVDAAVALLSVPRANRDR